MLTMKFIDSENEDLCDEEEKWVSLHDRIHSTYSIDYSSLEKFIESVVEILPKEVGTDTVEYAKTTEDSLWLHMGLGMWIRNVFIWPEWYNLEGFRLDGDSLSHLIIEKLRNTESE